MKIGIALSGGGARGAAHAGVLKVLEDYGIVPDIIAGSSAGAMVGALYAAGYKPEDILQFFKMNANIFRWQYLSRTKPGLLNAEKYAAIFAPWLNGHTFESLSKELHICVTDVLRGKVCYFNSGALVQPILASAAVPGIFTPVEIDDQWYIDGGTMNNFPVEPIKERCDILLGSFVSPKKSIERTELTNTFKLVNRANDLIYFSASKARFHLCDFLFLPEELHRFGVFETKKFDAIYQVGYEHALCNIQHVQKMLDDHQKSFKNGEDVLPHQMSIEVAI